MSETTDRKISVLIAITRLAVGGAPQSVLTSIAGLDSERYRIVLVSGYPGADEGSLIDEARRLGVTLHLISDLQRAPHPMRDLKAFWHLWRLMRREQVDIVHTHLSKAGILGRLAAWLAGVPVIVHTFHGDVLEGYFSKIKSLFFTKAERLVGRVTHRFVCVSKALQERLANYTLGPPDAFQVISNGIVVDDFGPVAQGVKRRVGTLAMFYPVKRLDLFVQMAHRLREVHPDVQCDISGDGMEADVLRCLSMSLGEPVNFLGICRDRSEFFKDLDVFVLCSDFEGAGMGLMEAMAAGVAVVATRVGGVPEIVQDGETGVLIPSNDVDALCEAVCGLLEDDALRQRLGKTARHYAQEHFSHTKMVEELDMMYRDLVKQV